MLTTTAKGNTFQSNPDNMGVLHRDRTYVNGPPLKLNNEVVEIIEIRRKNLVQFLRIGDLRDKLVWDSTMGLPGPIP